MEDTLLNIDNETEGDSAGHMEQKPCCHITSVVGKLFNFSSAGFQDGCFHFIFYPLEFMKQFQNPKVSSKVKKVNTALLRILLWLFIPKELLKIQG